MPGAIDDVRSHRHTPFVLGLVILWGAIYAWLLADDHLSLRTNAFDLSVFDYALWSTGRIGLGHVPFMGHSLFSHHFMPTLLALWLPWQLFESPAFLIATQLVAFGGASWLLYRLMPGDLPLFPALAILAAFLFGRRSHSAVMNVFYVESLEPLLIFAMLLAWRTSRTSLAVAAGLLALGCKEDVAIYLAVFGAVWLFGGMRKQGAVVVAASLVWLAVAVGWAVPAARQHDGLTPANPFVAAAVSDRGGAPGVPKPGITRLANADVLRTIATITASTGLLCWLAPAWTTVGVAGVLVTVAANPHTSGIGVSGHYLFPILPWIFFAGVEGAARLHRRRPAILRAVSALLLLATIGDSPLRRAIFRFGENDRRDAVAARVALRAIPADAPVVATPNLVPHLPHREKIWTLDERLLIHEEAAYAAISHVGNLWPLDAARAREASARYAADPRFRKIASGSVDIFQRITD